MIPYGRQHIDTADARAVLSALRSDRLTQGPLVGRFEEALARYCGARYAVAVSNGTAALHLACLAAGVGRGDEVVTSPVTFLATSNAVIYAGGRPVFADVDAGTGNISAETIARALTQRTKAILVVHLAGRPADMGPISRLARDKGLMLIEDACHALGARERGKKIGACAGSDMAVFSFHPVKLITTGEGGAITTNDKKLSQKLALLRSHGMVRTPELAAQNGGWYYEMRELGFNYRITDLQCALGLSQLKKADGFILQRSRIAAFYNERFSDLVPRVRLPRASGKKGHAWHLYLLRVRSGDARYTRRKLYDFLHSKGIHAQVHYIPVYRQPYYRKNFNMKPSSYPNAELYYEEALSLPIFPGLSMRDARRVAEAVREFFGK